MLFDFFLLFEHQLSYPIAIENSLDFPLDNGLFPLPQQSLSIPLLYCIFFILSEISLLLEYKLYKEKFCSIHYCILCALKSSKNPLTVQKKIDEWED